MTGLNPELCSCFSLIQEADVHLTSGSHAQAVLHPSPETLMTSGDMFGYYTCGGVIGFWRVEARNAVKHLTTHRMHGQAPQMNYLAPNVSHAKAEKRWYVPTGTRVGDHTWGSGSERACASG